MPEIQLTNNSTLNITASAPGGSATLNRYLKNPMVLLTRAGWDALVATKVGDLTPASFPLTATARGAAKFAVKESALSVRAGAVATVRLLRGKEKDELWASIQQPSDPSVNALVLFTLEGTVSGGLKASVSDFCFGVTKGASLSLSSVCAAGNDEKFIDVVKRAVTDMTIPRDIDDLKNLPANAICQVSGSSSLQFSASVTYSFVNDPLATKSLSKLPSITVNAVAGATLEATATHTGGHTVTIARTQGNKLHLGVDLARTDDFETSLTVCAGLTADVGSTDALPFLLGKISPNSAAETAQIVAGMPADQAAKLRNDIQSAINAAASNSLQVSLKTALEETKAQNRLFTYEIDLAALNANSAAALESALDGDFTALTNSGSLAGIRQIDSALVLTSKAIHTFALHLLGIFNEASVNTFIQKSVVSYTKDTHEIVLSDQTIEIDVNNLYAKKLRQVLLKGITLTIPASAGTPDEKTPINIVFFDRQASTDPSTMRQFVNVLRATGAPNATAATSLLRKKLNSYGTSSLHLSLSLSPQQCRQLFRDATGKPPDWSYYLRYACEAQATILDGDDAAASLSRLKLFQAGDAFWSRLKHAGSAANQAALLKQAGIVQEAETDVLTFIWWSSAMEDYAKALAANQSLEEAGQEVVTGGTRGFSEPWLILATWKMLGNPAVVSVFNSSLLKLALSAV
jgi:hypothetical protein